MNIIDKKYWYFLISLIVIIPGIISLMLFGLDLSIDFTGGTNLSLTYPNTVNSQEVSFVKTALTAEKLQVLEVSPSGNQILVRTAPMTQAQDTTFLTAVKSQNSSVVQDQFDTIGPTIGQEITTNAVKAVLISSVMIILYISYIFRKVPKPASSIRFGVSAVIALVHDVLVLLGVFSLLGHFFHVQVDSLFMTAVLTVIGFSVHDTIVVFDRIRENLAKSGAYSFSKVVNDSILQTLGRSLNTSLTVVLVLFALLIFGGESIRWFVVALLVGVISGTYSSIFNASPILVVWHDWSQKRKSK